MRITVRSPAGVYRLIDIQCDVENEIEQVATVRERRQLERQLAALALFESGFSYGEVAKALDIGKTTAFRRVRAAHDRFRQAVSAAGVEPCG
jgi:DNA-directed RNA polymerase specialized sigma24 family protein